MKYLKKTLSFVLALAMVFTMVIVPRTGVVNAEGTEDTTNTTNETQSEYTYFNTTMFKYNTDEFNKVTKQLETKTKKVSDTPITKISPKQQVPNVLIVSNGYALGSDGKGVEFDSIKKSDSIDDSLLWTIYGENGKRYIRNQSTNEFLNISTSSVSVGEKAANIFVENNYIYIKVDNKRYDLKGGSEFEVNYSQDSSKRSTTNLYKAVSQGIYFNIGSNTTYIDGKYIGNEDYNRWTGKSNIGQTKAYTNLVYSELDSNGNIKFKYPEAGIFDTSTKNGKSYYTDLEMPFRTDSDGYYYYDSQEYDVKFPNTVPEDKVQLDHEDKSTIRGKTAFLPFTSKNSYQISYKNINNKIDGDQTITVKDANDKEVNMSDIYHFGMNMSIDFYMTSDGLIDHDTSKPVTFEFSGDDDVWVFIDGKLVLDIGGIHDAIKADINFATGVANVYNGINDNASVNQSNNIYNTDQKTGIFGTDATTWRNDEDKVHTLQVFYLERGAGESNCKIKFNLPRKDKLEVTKSLGNKDTDDADLKALLTQKFKFKISYSTDGRNYSNYANKEYYIYKKGSYTGKTGTTNDNGEFELGFNEKALFKGADLSKGYYYKVQELVPEGSNYTSTWKTSKTFDKITSTSDSTKATDAIIQTENNTDKSKIGTYKFIFTNTFEPTLNDDLVVLDYGKAVKIDVLANDVLYGSKREIKSIKKDNVICENGDSELTLDNGGLTLIDNNTQLQYTPTKYMNSVDEATYSVYLDALTTPTEESANVYIMPANSVYYEDDFAYDSANDDPSVSIVWDGNWEQDITGNDDSSDADEIQDSANIQYGWDSSYKDDKGYSNGSANVSETVGDTATFRFTGTGVDVYSRTNTQAGKVIATLYKVDKVDKDSEGKEELKAKKLLVMDNKSASGDYYQIPTLYFKDLDYGTYEVKITVSSVTEKQTETSEDGNQIEKNVTRSKYYLDGIRVYNPLGVAPTDPIVKKAYIDAVEYNALYKSVRDMLILDPTTIQNNTVDGVVFIDEFKNGDSGTTAELGTYKDYGPKNEVYLAKGQAIAFKINTPYTGKVFIGAKSPTGESVPMKVTDENGNNLAKEVTVDHTSDMYYEITPTDSNYVVIQNAGVRTGDTDEAKAKDDAPILSITKLRLTGVSNAQTATLALSVDEGLISYANTFASLKSVSTTDNGVPIVRDDSDVEIENPDDTDNGNNNNEKYENIYKLVKYLFNAISKWFSK